jgi:endonuclease-3 related protein
LTDIYHRLLAAYGPQGWWPVSSPSDPFEVIVGAILTQSTAWTNVEKAIANLKKAQALSPEAIRSLPPDELGNLIYSSGYYKAKARKLHAFSEYIRSYDDDLSRLFSLPLEKLRAELLSIHGIGEETADSIILYAAGKPIFVIDAYTRRVGKRLGLKSEKDSYATWQRLFTDNLPSDPALFNEYHALFVRHGKEICRKNPRCEACCLHQGCLCIEEAR